MGEKIVNIMGGVCACAVTLFAVCACVRFVYFLLACPWTCS